MKTTLEVNTNETILSTNLRYGREIIMDRTDILEDPNSATVLYFQPRRWMIKARYIPTYSTRYARDWLSQSKLLETIYYEQYLIEHGYKPSKVARWKHWVVKRVAKRLGCVYTEQAALDKLCIDRDEAMKEWLVPNMTPKSNTVTQLW